MARTVVEHGELVAAAVRALLVGPLVVRVERRLRLDIRALPVEKRAVELDLGLGRIELHVVLLVDDVAGGVGGVGLLEVSRDPVVQPALPALSTAENSVRARKARRPPFDARAGTWRGAR